MTNRALLQGPKLPFRPHSHENWNSCYSVAETVLHIKVDFRTDSKQKGNQLASQAEFGVCFLVGMGGFYRHQERSRPVWETGNGLEHEQITKSALSGSNSAVECQLPKLDVAGSIPVSRSMFSRS